MARKPRIAPGGVTYHVLNRAVAHLTLFRKPADYAAFERVMRLALERYPVRLLDYCLMPTHWHFVLRPELDGQLTEFVRWLTHVHVMRWHAHYGTSGSGHLYQARFKAFPIQEDAHFLTVCRYVERNPVRAGLVGSAHRWRWSSLWWRVHAAGEAAWLSDWPVERPPDWLAYVQQPLSAAELDAVRNAVKRGAPYGSVGWQKQVAQNLSLEHTLRPMGRPTNHRL